jgi:hypothetical protein
VYTFFHYFTKLLLRGSHPEETELLLTGQKAGSIELIASYIPYYFIRGLHRRAVPAAQRKETQERGREGAVIAEGERGQIWGDSKVISDLFQYISSTLHTV